MVRYGPSKDYGSALPCTPWARVKGTCSMSIGLIGRKVGMTSVFQPDGTMVAVSVLSASHPDQPRAPQLVRDYVRYGASPRGAQALVTAGKISALLDGRFNVSIDDIRAAALPALRHRIILNFEGEAEGITAEAIVRSILDAVPAPTVE